MPKWANPPRQLYLAKLTFDYLLESGWQLDLLTGEFYHPQLEKLYQQNIAYWQEDDRAELWALWQAEQKAMHRLGEAGRTKGEFDAIARDIFFAEQPQHYIEGLGINILVHRPFAKIRLASSYVCLFVDIGDALRGISKNRKRKAIRYGKVTPEVKRDIDKVCSLAVRDFRR